MSRHKKGLRVKWCENVAKYAPHTKGQFGCKLARVSPDGWYVQTWSGKKAGWLSMMDLCFAREKDALRAAAALAAAGLDCHAALARADGMIVKQIACEFLQW